MDELLLKLQEQLREAWLTVHEIERIGTLPEIDKVLKDINTLRFQVLLIGKFNGGGA